MSPRSCGSGGASPPWHHLRRGPRFFGPNCVFQKVPNFLQIDDANIVLRLGVLLVAAELTYGVSLGIRAMRMRCRRKEEERRCFEQQQQQVEHALAKLEGEEDATMIESAEEDTQESIPLSRAHARHPSDSPRRERGEEVSRPASPSPCFSSASAIMTPWARIQHYWDLTQSAISTGIHKAPGKTIAIKSIGAFSASTADGISGKDRLTRVHESLLVLPEDSCFFYESAPLAQADSGMDGDTNESWKANAVDNLWDTLHLIWADRVRYTVNTDEIRSLLLACPAFSASMVVSCSPSPYPSSVSGRSSPKLELTQQRCEVAAANLAIMWFLTHLRAVYDALVVRSDTNRCSDELEELTTHRAELYRRFIEPTLSAHTQRRYNERDLTSTMVFGRSFIYATASNADAHGDIPTSGQLACSPAGCWAIMTAAETRLRRLHRTMSFGALVSLFRYMYATSHAKLASSVLLGILTGVSSRVAETGVQARGHVSTLLTQYYGSDSSTSSGGSKGCIGGEERSLSNTSPPCSTPSAPVVYRVVALCSFELVRLAINVVLSQGTHQYITAMASQRRDLVKAEVYNALTHLPMAYFDLHSYDEIEEMVYYVNDMEGVDVHVHQFLYTAATSLLAMRAALMPLTGRARALIIASVAASHLIRAGGSVIGRWYRRCQSDGTLPWFFADQYAAAIAGQELDARQIEENFESAGRKDGIMLRGLEIIAALPQLRPYGADVDLMGWWNQHVSGLGRMSGDRTLVWIHRPQGKLLPALGKAFLSLTDWLLPLLVSAYGAGSSTTSRLSGSNAATVSFHMMAGMTAVGAAVDVGLDARRVLDVVLCNAYKASVLENVCNPRCWEVSVDPLAREDEEGSNEGGGGSAETSFASGTAAMDSPKKGPESVMASYEYTVRRVVLHDVQFRYPSAPTVDVFHTPLSANILLQDPETGVGKLVCLAGPSGCGKSTVLSLLLGLYTDYFNSSSGASHADPLSQRGISTEDSEEGKSPFEKQQGPPRVELELVYSTPLRGPGDHSGVSTLLPSPLTSRKAPSPSTTDTAAAALADESAILLPVHSILPAMLRRRLFSYVPQQPSIFPGATIAHNISLDGYVSLEEQNLLHRAQLCADLAYCDYIHKFPQGLLTPIGDSSSPWSAGGGVGGAVRLSGGQAQRLMVARALYRGGGVLLMDEPTANLDSETRAAVMREWRQLLANGTIKGILCVTHDEAVIAAADEVVRIGEK